MEPIAAKNLTIGVCHPAYRIEPVIRQRLPETRVFQESTTSAIEKRMPKIDLLAISGAWHNSLLKGAERLKWIQSIGVGFDQFPLDELKSCGIRLSNATGVNANAVSEHAMALILALVRRLHEACQNRQRRHWQPMISNPEDREDELGGKTLGIIGLGTIGNRLAIFGKAFDMRVIGTKGNPATYRGVVDDVLPPERLDDLLKVANFVVVCCPLKADTIDLIGAAELAHMRPSSYFVNVARGPVVVEADLISALQEGKISGAVLDVTIDEPLAPDSPLWQMNNVLITPHTGGETSYYEKRLVDIIVENIRHWERREPFVHQIV